MPIGFLFPGQGAQYVGMGQDLVEVYPVAREIFEAADATLGFSIREICANGPEEKLTRTLYAQPAIFTVSAAALAVLRQKFPGLKPAFAAGLSLGEFSALFAAGAIGFADGLRLVQSRAAAMEKCAERHPGTMASVMGLSQEICEDVSREAGCIVANLNAPDQFVLSGTLESIDRACQLAEARDAKRAIKLKVGGAFHSSLMHEAQDALGQSLRNTAIASPQCIFIPNATAKKTEDPELIRNLLALQLTSPVRWIETMKRAEEEGIKYFLEIGPGKVLKGLARKTFPSGDVRPCGTAAELEKLVEVIHAIGV